jgi:hypothetical protein
LFKSRSVAAGGQCTVTLPQLSVPYALKAADAQTLGGLPPSAFALAPPSASASGAGIQPAATTAKGTVTSVGLSGPVSDFTVSGFPVTTNGDAGAELECRAHKRRHRQRDREARCQRQLYCGSDHRQSWNGRRDNNCLGQRRRGHQQPGGTAVYGGGNTGVGVWSQSFGTSDMQVSVGKNSE